MWFSLTCDLRECIYSCKQTNQLYSYSSDSHIYTREKWLIKYYNIEPELSVEYTVVLVSQNNLGDEPFELPHSRGYDL